MQEAAAKRDIDLSEHRSTRVTKAVLDEADLIFIMDYENYEALREFDSGSLGKVIWIGAMEDGIDRD